MKASRKYKYGHALIDHHQTNNAVYIQCYVRTLYINNTYNTNTNTGNKRPGEKC